MNQLIFNSFPRSGNIYSQQISSVMFGVQVATVHIPQIFGVEGLNQVTLFRKPADAFSSLIYRNYPEQDIEDHFIRSFARKEMDHYREYIKYATMYHDNIYIGRFDDLSNDPVGHFRNISKRFGYKIRDNSEERVLGISSELTSKIWSDDLDGHYPREKSSRRQEIEELVSGYTFVQNLELETEEFLSKYQTKV